MFFSLQFYIQVIEVLHYVSKKSIGFLHISLTSREKTKFLS